MMIVSKETDWHLGHLVNLSWNQKEIKKSGRMYYANYAESRYVCIREATDGQRGILIKGLGKIQRNHVMLVNGKPFCKDEREELFMVKCYFSFPFPTADELKEVLDIVRFDMNIQQKLIDNGMFFNPNGTFWVSDTKSQFFGLKRSPQYYDPSTGCLATAKSLDERHNRITIAYF
jgi:hypothetical protein